MSNAPEPVATTRESACSACGLPVRNPDDFDPAGPDRYDDTPGGHADRHTLVIEAAERAAGIRP